jgi:hypothetical protein
MLRQPQTSTYHAERAKNPPGEETAPNLSTADQTFALDVAFTTHCGLVEVMQPLSGSTPMQKYLDQTSGKGGIQHVAFDIVHPSFSASSDGNGEVASTQTPEQVAHSEATRRRQEFERRGFPVIMSGVWKGKK